MSRTAPKSPRLPIGTYGPFFFPRRLSLTLAEAHHHLHVMGTSGSGKSRFLAHWYVQLLTNGCAATLIDPHGDTARLVLAALVHRGYFARPQAKGQLLYLDLPGAAERGLYLPFNLLKRSLPPTTIAADFKEAMHRAFPELAEGAATFDTLLPRAIRVLVHHQLPVTSLERFLLDSAFRSALLSSFPDGAVQAYFARLDRLREGDQFTYVGSVLRRAQLLSDLPILRHSLGQPENLLDYRALMDGGTSVIVNLAVQEQEAARLLGCLLTVAAEQGAMSRRSVLPEERGPAHFLFLDEFANFTAQSEKQLSTMLSQTRKMGLFAVLANQTWSQTSAHLRGSLQNVGIEVAFKLGREDAEHSSRIFGTVDPLTVKHEVDDTHASERTHPAFYSLPEQWEQWTQTLHTLKRQEAYVRTAEDRVYHVKTAPFPDPPVDRRQLRALEEHYLTTYFRPPEPASQEAPLLPAQPQRPRRITPLEE